MASPILTFSLQDEVARSGPLTATELLGRLDYEPAAFADFTRLEFRGSFSAKLVNAPILVKLEVKQGGSPTLTDGFVVGGVIPTAFVETFYSIPPFLIAKPVAVVDHVKFVLSTILSASDSAFIWFPTVFIRGVP